MLAELALMIRALPTFDGGAVTARSRFDELGLDSLDRLELLVAIEDRWGIALSDEQLTSPAVGDVAAALRARLEAGSPPEPSRG